LRASSKKDKTKERLGWLDFGKVLGILVVLLVHAECSLGPVTYYGGMFYMPVFFVAAGYTYHVRREEPIGGYVKKKAARLLVPYFSTSLFLWFFFWVKDSAVAGRPLDLKPLSLFGILYSRNQMYTSLYTDKNPVLLNILNAPLWFLTAMFLVCIWYEFISRSRRKYLLLVIGAALSVLWHYCTGFLLPWSLEAVPFFACYFAAGEALREQKREGLLGELWFLGLLLAVFLISSKLNGVMNLSNGTYGHSMLLALASGTSGSLLVFAAGMCMERKCPPVMKAISLAGRQTLWVLCFHMFLFMFIRTGAGMLHLGRGLTQAALVLFSFLLLTGAGLAVGRLQQMMSIRMYFKNGRNEV